MPNTKGNNRRVQEGEKNRRGRLAEKSSSFHGRMSLPSAAELRRPKTLPNLLSAGKDFTAAAPEVSRSAPRLTKLLLNVTIQGSLGAVQLVMSPECTVGELVAAAIRQYQKEGRRPFLASAEPSRFDLHYSQFSLESLEREEKLIALGSRNFFLCPKKAEMDRSGGGITASSSTASCSKQADKVKTTGFPWLKFIDFLP